MVSTIKLTQAVSRRLSKLSVARDMTQYQLYMKRDVLKSTIGNIINCSYHAVKFRSIHEMCQRLEIGIDIFLHLYFSKKIIRNHEPSDKFAGGLLFQYTQSNISKNFQFWSCFSKVHLIFIL